MAHTQYIDELVKEYLLFRGFGNTLKAFDAELKTDKERSFRVDKVIEHLLFLINTYDLGSLREFWLHLDKHMFTKLESHFMPGVKKLENAVLKMYLINALTNNKADKVNDFFLKMTPELQGQSEWKEWFMLPYIKNVEENPVFSLHFTKQWQDTLLISLHNFLASIFQYMPKPTLLHFEEDAAKIEKLEERNKSLKSRLSLLLDKGPEVAVTPVQVEPPAHLLDDFYVIAQENNISENQSRGLKSLIRNMGSNTSPILGRKDNAAGSKKRTGSSTSRSGKSSQFYDS